MIQPNRIVDMDDETFLTITRMRQQALEMAHEQTRLGRWPATQTLQEAVEFIKEEIGIMIQTDHLIAILNLYPIERSKLTVYGWGDTEIRDLVCDVISMYFLNCEWPIGRDNVDLKAFIKRLRLSAQMRGFQLSQV